MSQDYMAKLEKPFVRYTVAFFVVVLAMLSRFGLDGLVSEQLPPFLTFYPAVMIAAILGGLWPGVLATLTSTFVVDLWLIKPYGSLRTSNATDTVSLIFFCCTGVFLSLFAERYHRDRRRIAELDREAALHSTREALRESQDRIRAIFEAVEEGIVFLNTAGGIVEVNHSVERILGYTVKDLMDHGLNLRRRFLRVDGSTLPIEEIPAVIALRTGQAVRNTELGITGPDGRVRWILVNARPLRDEDGKLLGAVASFSDHSARKAAEEAMRESKQRLRNFIEHAPAALAVLDRDLCYLGMSRRFREDFGLGDRDLTGRRHYDVFRTIPENIQAAHRRALAGEVVGSDNDLFRQPDGKLRNKRWEVRPWFERGGGIGGIEIFTEDITERKRVEDELRRADERFSKAFRCSPLPIAINSLEDGRFLDVNDAYLEMSRYSREQLIGQSSLDIGFWVEPSERAGLIATLQKEGRVRQSQLRFRTGQGEIRKVDYAAELIDLDGQSCILSISRDITEQLALEAQLRQAQKMEAIGNLAGGVAHDFNNILGVIIGYCDLTIDELAPGTSVAKNVARIKKASVRAAGLTRQLLTFGRRQVVFPVVLHLDSAIQGVTSMLLRMVSEDVRITVDAEAGPRNIKADPGQLEQIVMNLVVNARDAMPQGGDIRIATAHRTLEPRDLAEYSGCAVGSYLALVVSDTGHGMSPATMSSIFEPFFTTKEVGVGTGLGLSTVYGIVKQCGGTIRVSSELGKGAAFEVLFPEVHEPVTRHASTEATVRKPAQAGVILLVEDSESLRELITIMLQQGGYEVIEACDAESALRLLRESEKKPDLLLTDVIMPGRTGVELLAEALREYPAMRGLFMSGYSPDLLSERGGSVEESAFLQKPFNLPTLLAKVHGILHKDEIS